MNDATPRAVDWVGVLDRGDLTAHEVAARDRMADAARDARWRDLLGLVDGYPSLVNAWRVGGRSWFAPLHQAAWHGAEGSVVRELIERGAWRGLPDAHGRTPRDIAIERGHHATADLLGPPLDPGTIERHRALDEQLHRVIEARIRPAVKAPLRHPATVVLVELRQPRLWYPVPGMHGGFRVELRRRYLFVESWSRVVGGSGQAHVVTHEGATLVDEGFV